jgi:hypothetical protein
MVESRSDDRYVSPLLLGELFGRAWLECGKLTPK